MSSFEVRAFRRADRDQLTRLVNGHAAAVMPGASVSVNTVLSQLEREPSEFIVDPWVAERQAVVAEQAGAIVAAALMIRYRPDSDVGESFRNAGEIRWLLFWPMAPDDNPFWHDGHDAAEAVMRHCLEQFARWQVVHHYADGSLPHPGVYGVPPQWPHIERLYERTGFEHCGATEIIMMADINRFPEPSEPPLPGLGVRRLVGLNGTRLTAHVDGDPVAHIEVEELDQPERHPRSGGLADIGNLYVHPDQRRQQVGSWLLHHATSWLRLGRTDRLLAYTSSDDDEAIQFLQHHRFQEITRTRRGWTHRSHDAPLRSTR